VGIQPYVVLSKWSMHSRSHARQISRPHGRTVGREHRMQFPDFVSRVAVYELKRTQGKDTSETDGLVVDL
jgi:hypothetical protein